ncbi:5-formyltetrahydrofolate cyclo-ligase, partial [Halobium palmae]
VATTVHERQVVADDEIETDAHDVPMDYVVTPERTVETGAAGERPTGVDWGLLDEERLAEIPVLDRFRND